MALLAVPLRELDQALLFDGRALREEPVPPLNMALAFPGFEATPGKERLWWKGQHVKMSRA
jgi:hypothetical protein